METVSELRKNRVDGGLRITIDSDDDLLLPASEIKGEIFWKLDEVPEQMLLRLFWYTEGRGTRDVGIIAERSYHPSGLTGNASFSFSLPDSPYSFDGQLISLKWALELICPKVETAKAFFVMAPFATEIRLGRVEKSRT